MDFAEEALRALSGDHGDGVGNVIGGEDFGRVFRTAAGELRGYAAGTDSADADAMDAQVFSHAAAEALQSPLGGAVDAAASEGVFPCQGGDVDNVAGFALDHARYDGARNQEHAFEIGV